MSLRQTIKTRAILFYVALNYIISWTFLYPCYQAILHAEEGTFPLMALIGIPGGFGPTIAAIITVWLTEGKPAVYQLLRKFKSFKVQAKWYLFVLTIPLILYLFSLLSTNIFGFDLGKSEYMDGLKMALPYFFLALPFGPLMEELGWRGYLLPALLKKYNIFVNSQFWALHEASGI